LSGVNAGRHKIKVSVFDDIDNQKSREVWIDITNSFAMEINWISPTPKQIIAQKDFPINLSLIIPVLKVQKIKFLEQQLKENSNLLGTIFSPESAGVINFSWPMTDVGTHQIWAEITDINGKVLITDKIQIEIE